MDNKNVIFNHTLEQYNKKYRNCKDKLLKFTKKEVEEFDKLTNSDIKGYLLKDRKWWFTKEDGCYHEIPKAPRYTWFRNLNAGVQAGCCLLGVGGVASAIVVPTVILTKKDGSVEREITIDEEVAEHVKCESKMVDGKLEIILKPDTGFKVTGIKEIKINDYILKDTEYKYEDNKVSITKEVLDAHTGKIVVTPSVVPETEDKLEVTVLPTRWIYIVGEQFSSDGLKVVLQKTTGEKEDVTSKCTLSIKDGTVLSEVADEKEVNVTFGSYKTSLKIAVNDTCDNYLEEVQDGDKYKVKARDNAKLPKHLLIPKILNVNKLTHIMAEGFKNNTDIETLDLSQTEIKNVCYASFQRCTNLKKVIIGNDIETIGDSDGATFNDCFNLEEVVFKNVNPIKFPGGNAFCFKNCSKLGTITLDTDAFAKVLKDDTEHLDVALFSNALLLYIKAGITPIENSFITKNYHINTSLNKDGYNEYKASEYVYNNVKEGECEIKAGIGLVNQKDLTIPSEDPDTKDKVVAITSKGFEKCKKINNVILPTSIKSIGDSAFEGSTIKSIELNEGLTELGDSCFSACNLLEEINIPSTLSLFDKKDDVFSGCEKLGSLILNKNEFVNYTPEEEWETCSGLFVNPTTIFIKNTMAPQEGTYIYNNFTKASKSSVKEYDMWIRKSTNYAYTIIDDDTCSIKAADEASFGDTILLPNYSLDGRKVVKIEDSGFESQSGLGTVILSRYIKTIGTKAFASNTDGLYVIKLNEGLESIGDSAFNGSTNLNSFNIPSTVTYIGTDAFNSGGYAFTITLDNVSIMNATQAEVEKWKMKANFVMYYINERIVDQLDTKSYLYNNFDFVSIENGYCMFIPPLP